jgi:hypothetical protein
LQKGSLVAVRTQPARLRPRRRHFFIAGDRQGFPANASVGRATTGRCPISKGKALDKRYLMMN